MGTDDRRKPARRSLKKKSLPYDNETYKELLDRSPEISEEAPEVEAADTTEEQLELYRKANEEIIREGRA